MNNQMDLSRPITRLQFPLIALLIFVCLIRLWLEISYLNQPIFEGYIGRQIPTAMVARDLGQGGSFFYPKLQTGPFPSYFLVEPPIYAWLTAKTQILSGLTLEASGRLVSLCGSCFTAAGLYLWAKAKTNNKVALFSFIFFLSMPVSIRYGRAFQPDSLATGLIMLGSGLIQFKSKKYQILGMVIISMGITTKITLIPFTLIAFCQPEMKLADFKKILYLILVISIPAILWYFWVFAFLYIKSQPGAGQSADGLKYWWLMIGPLGFSDLSKLKEMIKNIFWSGFTPLFPIIIISSIALKIKFQSIFSGLVAILFWLLLVGAKAHHGYYWLVAAPFFAIMIALFIDQLSKKQLRISIFLILLLITTGFLQSARTWQTPPEWQPIVQDLNQFQNEMNRNPDSMIIGPEAVIFAFNRSGLRWEWPADAQIRAASTWGTSLSGQSPAALLEFYRSKGGRWFLALETDPQWVSEKEKLMPSIGPQSLVISSGGLLLYDIELTASEPR
jgi:hypothetical protein